MPSPIIFIVHPELSIRRAISIQLNGAFGSLYRYEHAGDPEEAYELLDEWQDLQETVILFLVDAPDTFDFLTVQLPLYRKSNCLVIDRDDHHPMAQLIDAHGSHNLSLQANPLEPIEFLHAVRSKLPETSLA